MCRCLPLHLQMSLLACFALLLFTFSPHLTRLIKQQHQEKKAQTHKHRRFLWFRRAPRQKFKFWVGSAWNFILAGSGEGSGFCVHTPRPQFFRPFSLSLLLHSFPFSLLGFFFFFFLLIPVLNSVLPAPTFPSLQTQCELIGRVR